MDLPAGPSQVNAPPRVAIGGFTLDLVARRLTAPDGRDAPLRAKSFAVLAELAAQAGRVVSREELLTAVWPGLFVTDDSVTQCITEIRAALGPAEARRLRTISKRGYLLDAAAPEQTDRTPRIAVLAFDNLSRDPRWDRLADGLAEDIITDLARCPELRVIARNSSFAFRGRPTDAREIGEALGVGYLLEGSVQADRGQVALTAQLIETAGGEHVWAERLLRPEAGLFDAQADITGRVAASLAGFSGRIATAELRRLQRRPPASLAAYELFLLGAEQEARLDEAGTLAAIPLLERALAADPGMSRAWTMLGFALGNAAGNGWGGDPGPLRARQREAIRRAAALDPDDGLTLVELGAMRLRDGEIAAGREAFERAAVAGANHADTLALLAKYMVEVVGRPEAAIAMTERCFALNPLAPDWYRLGELRVAFFTGRFDRAAALAARAPAFRLPALLGALALAGLGDRDGAQAALAAHAARFGAGAWRATLAGLPPLCPGASERLDAALALAGLSRCA